jgi:hypothetical protein
LAAIPLGEGFERLPAVAQRDTELLEIAFCEQAQGFEVNVILGEDLRVLR